MSQQLIFTVTQQPKSVLVDNKQIFYYLVGNIAHPKVVFLHGSTATSLMYSSIINLLAANNFYVMAIDLPGHGLTNAFDDYQPGIYRKAIQAAIYNEKFDDFTIVGHSLGGFLAVYCAQDEEFRKHFKVNKIVALTPAGLFIHDNYLARRKTVMETMTVNDYDKVKVNVSEILSKKWQEVTQGFGENGKYILQYFEECLARDNKKVVTRYIDYQYILPNFMLQFDLFKQTNETYKNKIAVLLCKNDCLIDIRNQEYIEKEYKNIKLFIKDGIHEMVMANPGVVLEMINSLE